MKLILNVVLILVFLGSVLLDKAYRAVDVKELKRRARGSGDGKSARIYKMAAYGRSLETFLWLVSGASAVALIIMAADYSWWLALLVVLAVLRLVWLGRPLDPSDNLGWSLAAMLAGPTAALVGLLQPILNLIPGSPGSPARYHTGVYEKDDLLQFIKRQNQQADNRISDQELQLALGALSFGDKPVAKVMTPKSKAKFVTASDSIGPHLMDELHGSGLASFPVVKDGSKASDKEVIGTLYLSDVVDRPEGGRVRDVMKSDVYFVNEQQSLQEALAIFLKKHSHMLVVVNNFEELTGVLTIEHVVEQMLGQKPDDGFEGYDDPRVVADIENRKHHKDSSP